MERIVWFHDASHSNKPNFFQKLFNCFLYGKEEGLSFYQKQWEELEATGREEGATQARASSNDSVKWVCQVGSSSDSVNWAPPSRLSNV